MRQLLSSFSFADAIEGLDRGDFSRIEPVFTGDPCEIVRWYEQGLFEGHGEAAAEALTCACFLGRTGVALYLLRQGLDPSGGSKTGMNAFHWAANRGQLESVSLLIEWKTPWETLNMYGGNVPDAAVWSALHEPRPDHLAIVELLIRYCALPDRRWLPTGNPELDAILRPALETGER